MIEPVASAGDTRVDAIPPEKMAKLCWGVRAAIDDDWLVFLDVSRNRYRAIKKCVAPAIAGVAAPSPSTGYNMTAWLALAQDGLVTGPPNRGAVVRAVAHVDAKFRDIFSLALAALWTHRIVKCGALIEAFGTLSAAKAKLAADEDGRRRALHAHDRFVAARIWIPARYVCLFDSLCLMRLLLAEGISADLVFGVRGRPFAAHCWVECEGEILDDGGEACASFVEIVRI